MCKCDNLVLFIEGKCASVIIWFSTSLSTFTNGLVWITASTSVNIVCNLELVRLILPIFFLVTSSLFLRDVHRILPCKVRFK